MHSQEDSLAQGLGNSHSGVRLPSSGAFELHFTTCQTTGKLLSLWLPVLYYKMGTAVVAFVQS